MSGISPEPYFHTMNESNFKAFQNLVGEHSVKGDPSSLYNLTKSDPDPLSLSFRTYKKSSVRYIKSKLQVDLCHFL